MQDCWQWFIWRRLPDKAVTLERRCCDKEGSAGQEVQGALDSRSIPYAAREELMLNQASFFFFLFFFQNRELQIMRIVRHPNIVQLKAFYYSNGERVSTDT